MRRLDDHRHDFAAMMRFARAASAAIDAALVLAVAASARAQRRQGLADYLALQVHPGAGVGPNADGYDRRMTIPPEVAECLGTTKAPPAWLGSDIDPRRACSSRSMARRVRSWFGAPASEGGLDDALAARAAVPARPRRRGRRTAGRS